MTDEQILADVLHVMHNGWDGSEATRGWTEEDWRYNAEFYLPVIQRAVDSAPQAHAVRRVRAVLAGASSGVVSVSAIREALDVPQGTDQPS